MYKLILLKCEIIKDRSILILTKILFKLAILIKGQTPRQLSDLV